MVNTNKKQKDGIKLEKIKRRISVPRAVKLVGFFGNSNNVIAAEIYGRIII